MQKFLISLLTIIPVLVISCKPTKENGVPMRGVVLNVEDISSMDWPALALECGINTIGTHITPSQVADFISSDSGKQFMNDCQKYGINVEHQLHAMSDLLPRNLFTEKPELFRVDKKGERNPDFNCCAHSEEALAIIAQKASEYARILPATNHRYYFWLDDTGDVCHCQHCREYSASEQALIIENRMLKAIRKVDPLATLAHLAYRNTLVAPQKIKPEKGIFLEFAPFFRSWDRPLSDIDAKHTANATRELSMTHQENLKYLKDNLEVFPSETAVVLEYWLDVSLFSDWKKPAAILPWNHAVFQDDLDTYHKYGIQNITSFAAFMDSSYFVRFPETRDILKEYGGLVFLADPYILEDKGIYYLYGTGHKDGIKVLTSKDMKTWSRPENDKLALHKDDSYGDQDFWAPEVYHIGNKYIMYYTANLHICAAISSSPIGPFKQITQEPMTEEIGIDNSLFIDDDGTPYIFWVRWFKETGNEIWSAQLNEDLLSIIPGTERLCLKKSQAWEDVKLDVNEGPFVLKHNGTYYLTYSANCCSSQDYGVGYATANSILGPWEKYENNPILSSHGHLAGTGHHAIFKDKEGRLQMVFHSHNSKYKFRPRITHIAELFFSKNSSGKADIISVSQDINTISYTTTPAALHINTAIEYDGQPQIDHLTDFWNKGLDNTIIKISHDSENLLVEFDVRDTTLHINNEDSERSIDLSDRVEIFLCKDKDMSEYYCLEIDPTGKIMDYKASYYRQFDYSWTCPAIKTQTFIYDSGYRIEAAISKKWLKDIDLLSDIGEINIGFYRGDFIKGTKSDINWYCWHNPKVTEPDFHVPSSLGVIRLLE